MGLGTRRLVRSGSRTHLFPWARDRATNTIAVHLQALDSEEEAAHGVVSVTDAPMDALTITLHRLVEAGPVDAEALAVAVLNKESEKHEGFLDESLLCSEYAHRALDVEGEWRAMESIVMSDGADR